MCLRTRDTAMLRGYYIVMPFAPLWFGTGQTTYSYELDLRV